MEAYEKSGCTASGEAGSDKEEARQLSGIEKSILRERGRAMEEVELRYMLRYVKAEYMQEELARRNAVASDIFQKLKEKTHSLPSNMSYDEMVQLIMDVREIVRQGGQDHAE